MDDKQTYAQRLQALIDHLDKGNVSAFALRCDLGDSLLRKHLAGSEPGLDKVQKVALKTGCRLEWLAAGEGEMFASGTELNANQERAAYSVEFAFVNQYAGKPSAGAGSEIEDQAPVSAIAFRHDWLAKRRQSNSAKLAAFEIKGDSMEPTLFSGDLVVFDLAETTVTTEDIYLFVLGGNSYVKRLRLMPDDDVLMISDNPRYTPVTIDEETALARSFQVIGRFFWRGGDRL